MQDWKAHIDLKQPCWEGYRVFLDRLAGDGFPSPDELTSLLLPGRTNAMDKAIRFRPAGEIPGVAYEKHIHETGEVSTRENSWHDLFNALAWCRFPRLKSAMNEVHYRCLDEEKDGRRGSQRDALTLLDESGVIVTSSNEDLLRSLYERNWQAAFVDYRDAWAGTDVLICGHAILEKFLQPYKSMTAHAVYLHLPEPMGAAELDETLAETLLEGTLVRTPKDLSPLPLMGIPVWWPFGAQDAGFYADRDVFRPART